MPTNWKTVRESKLTREAQARVSERTTRALEELTLNGLRKELDLTQVEVGRGADMTQSELSRVESRDDHLTSTLRRYGEALGGRLEIVAVFGKRRVKLTDA